MAVSKAFPPVSLVRRNDTHRLVPSRYADRGESVLVRIADSDRHLQEIFELDHATNDRLVAESGALPGIGVQELIFGVPYSRIVNAAFTHPHPLGNRFSGPDRGAWYCAFAIETAQSEIAYHKTIDLAEIGIFEDDVTCDDYLADFSARFHVMDDAKRFARYLNPNSYVASQRLAEELLTAGSLGIVYPSVRHRSGTCIACLRPTLVMNVRKQSTYRFIWNGTPTPAIASVR